MSGGDAVATYEVSKRYGRETALDRVNLRVPDGAVYVLVGANGAGKSTTLKVLMNLERADTGTAEILGLDTVRRGPEARAQVGYVPERPDHGYRWMTCGALLGHVASYYLAWDRAYADRLSLAFGLRLHRKVGTLSKGARAGGCSSCWRWPIARPFCSWTSPRTASTRWCAAARCRCSLSTLPTRPPRCLWRPTMFTNSRA